MGKEKTDVATIPATDYKALAVSVEQFKRALDENIGLGSLNPFELDRLKVPAGGGLSFNVPTMDGDVSLKEIEGIVLKWKDTRGYWADPFSGQGAPPQCQSNDGELGIGDPGGLCETCPLSKFGSAPGKRPGERGRGQACKQSRLLFILRPTDLLPMVISVPPTSIGAAKKYFTRLASGSLEYWRVVTGFALEKARSGDGIEYSEMTFRRVRPLGDEEVAQLMKLREAMLPIFERETIRHADVNT